MVRPRPYSSLLTRELEKVAAKATPTILEDLLYELSFRSKPVAKKLATKVEAKLKSKKLGASQSASSGHLEVNEGGQGAQDPVAVASSKRRGARPKEKSRSTGPHASKPDFTPTAEQRLALEAFQRGGPLKISAFAGAGKTSTLQLMAASRQERGLYLAFNRSIAQDAGEKFPGHIDTRTTHSIAARHVRGLHGLTQSKMFSSMSANQLADVLDLQEYELNGHTRLTPRQLAFLLIKTVDNFCNSAERQVGLEHIATNGRLSTIHGNEREVLREWTLQHSRSLWSKMIDRRESIPLGHNGYLKMWSLDDPRLDYAYIMLDEAQDTNPVVLHVLQQQGHAQMIYVGDQHQQIYGWRGAINAMASMVTKEHVHLTQSFRFGPAIAKVASQVLRTLGESRVLSGFEQVQSRVADAGNAKTVLARTNATVIAEVLAAASRSELPAVVGGTNELQRLVEDVFSLQKGKPATQPEFFGFKSWNEVVAYAETDEGESVRPFVTLVQRNGPQKLWAAIKGSTDDESQCDVVISTAHKAKGREWPSIRIAEDFTASHTGEGKVPAAEARLFYVAATRAKEKLVVSPELLRAYTTGQATESGAIQRPTKPAAAPVRPSLTKTSDPSRTVDAANNEEQEVRSRWYTALSPSTEETTPSPPKERVPEQPKDKRRGFLGWLFG